MSKVVQFENDNKMPKGNLTQQHYKYIKKWLDSGERLEGTKLQIFQDLLSDRKFRI